MPAEDRYIVLSAKRNRRTTAQQVANQFLAASEKQISRKTVARRLRGGGLYARRPVVCVPLTRQHRTARLQWCREHHNWTEQDWACVLFSDESRFSLSSDCRRQLIWRESGTAYRPENIQEKDRYPTCSIMVWAGITINCRTCLHVVANGTMTGQRYIDEVLLPHDCLDSEGIQRLVWPARSPDLNPIENVWDALGRQVAGRNYPPTNKNTLIRALTEEWDKLPQQLLDNVVQSMAGRRAVLLARWIVRSVPLEIVGSSGHEKVPTCGKPGLERPGRPRGERIEGSCGMHLWTLQSLVQRYEQTRPGERYSSYHTVLRHTARTAGVMVWGAIAYDSRSTLIVMRGALTGQRYSDDMLRPHVGPFLNGLLEAIFQQDNAHPHTARVAQDFLRHFQTLPWPVRSPDLSPVEHV
ncbi:transposable element Tcb1 transposase [Trichonephila clavipes]|nr:transposable element Tcb1 transposase [Trichonephila clavipes]